MKLQDYNKPGTYLNEQDNVIYDVYEPEEGGLAIEVYDYEDGRYVTSNAFYNFDDLANVEVEPVEVMRTDDDILQIVENINIANLNEEVILELHSLATINEMAKINNQIELRNEDDGDNVKFAHFHFRNVHFKFSRQCPENKEAVIRMVAFPNSELQKLSSKDIKDLIKLLHSRWDKNSSMSVYEACIAVWGTLHDREIDYID